MSWGLVNRDDFSGPGVSRGLAAVEVSAGRHQAPSLTRLGSAFEMLLHYQVACSPISGVNHNLWSDPRELISGLVRHMCPQ